MAAGVAINNAIQLRYAHKIYKINPTTKKLSPFGNPVTSLDLAMLKKLGGVC